MESLRIPPVGVCEFYGGERQRPRKRKKKRTNKTKESFVTAIWRSRAIGFDRTTGAVVCIIIMISLFFFPSSSFSLLGEQHDESRLSGRRVQQPIVCCSSLQDVVKLVLWRRCTAIYDPFSLILFHFWLRSISTRARRQLFIYVALLMDDMEVQSATRSQAATTLDLMFR